MVYHAIALNRAATLPALIDDMGGDAAAVEASVQRLASYLLIEQRGDALRALSIEESILRCRFRHGSGTPLEIENGVIKIPDYARKGENK
ncbi:MAG: hypothetical protein PWP08_344 [Methanofollis sp.]|nr:hypothetical protein [Methanofollis sp.]